MVGRQADQDLERRLWTMVLDWVATGGFRSPRGGPQLVRDLTTLRHMYDSDSGQPRPIEQLPGGGREHGDRSRSRDAAPFERAVTHRR